MSFQILINIFIAVIWMFLQNSWDIVTFTLGYVLGLILLSVLRRFLSERLYILNVYALIKLIVIFFRELLLSSVSVLKQIISPKLNIRPGIFAMPTELTKDWEITTLSCLITLTPGTVVVDISDDNKTLYIHAMDIDTVEDAVKQIKDTFEVAIMEVSR